MNRAAILSEKQLGDITLLEPMTRLLAAQTGVPCAMHVKEGFKPLVELMPHAVWGPDLKEKYAVTWTTSWSSRAALQTFKLRAVRKILLANKDRHVRWWYRLIFNDIRLVPPGPEYWGSYFWRMAGGAPAEAFKPAQLNLPPEGWAHRDLPKEPFILINPTAAWERKFWAATHWQELLRSLATRFKMPVVMAGGGAPMEAAHCQQIAEGAPLPFINLAGRTSLKEYIHALSRASLVICVDGAASHLAHAFDLPTLTIFGPTSEQKWHLPAPHHRALAARQFTSEGFGPAAGVPVEAALNAVTELFPNPSV